MPGGELVDVLVMVVVVVMGAERVREAHQPAQGASELGVRMLEYPTLHARPGCGGAEVKMQREAVWLNMQSKKKKSGRGGRSCQEEEEVKAERREPRQTVASRGHGTVCSGAAETRRYEVFHVYGPAEMSTLLFLSASQLIRTPPSARGTNKKR